MGLASFNIVLLVAALAVYIALDPFHISPLAHLPNFTAKPVIIPPPRSLKFPRDHENKLQRSEIKFLNEVIGPESLAFDSTGRGPYAGIADGRIMRWDGPQQGWAEFSTLYPKGSEPCKPKSTPVTNLPNEHICGRPLGLHFMAGTGDLYIADAYHGLLVVGPKGGEATVVVGEAEGVQLGFTNGVEISSDGIVYFTDSSINYARRQFLLATLSGDDSGRLLRYDPSTKEVTVLSRGLQFPNGLAISKDECFLVVAETTTCRLLRFWIKGENAGTLEPFVLLPGPPDNVQVNEEGEFWVAIHCLQTPLVWTFFNYPWMRYTLLKLPIPVDYIYPIFLGGKPHAMALRFDAKGNLLEVLEDQTGKTIKLISDVVERDGKLWMGSVLMPYIGVYLK